ncbi:MAG: antitoxin HicB [Candidatus Yanofskybacteria bacterium RIFCSPLOWO2_02_FULL_47_9b]|uniref:Antitoxin HicB n=1 Tax=Candidatus Yanofskybacteria bacterium RIFCSPLOWO2_02_FULL_47_9b TaxID=1802708 RepID=A0A1F8H9V4_9BACT|nr:MAG: antitoxin HicB [Candidatus Yanofskybacteria bacterium RIFCSPLOWO2_02_FULL_47_9b]
MLTEFIQRQIKKARYKVLKDGSYFASIPGIKGVWANSKTKRACEKELGEVFEEWALLKVRNHERIPGLVINFDRREMLRHA